MKDSDINNLRNNVGTIMFEENDNIISYSGIGKERISNIKEFSVLTIEDIQTLVIKCHGDRFKSIFYMKDRIILVVYISTKLVTYSSTNSI